MAIDFVNLSRLIAKLESLGEEEFLVSEFMQDCGTPGCIAGWADHLMIEDGKLPKWTIGTNVDELSIERFLNIDKKTSEMIAYGYIESKRDDGAVVTRENAIEFLKALSEDPETKWSDMDFRTDLVSLIKENKELKEKCKSLTEMNERLENKANLLLETQEAIGQKLNMQNSIIKAMHKLHPDTLKIYES